MHFRVRKMLALAIPMNTQSIFTEDFRLMFFHQVNAQAYLHYTLIEHTVQHGL